MRQRLCQVTIRNPDMTTPATVRPDSALRRLGTFDALLAEGNRALQVLTGAATAARRNPADERRSANTDTAAATLTPAQTRDVAGLMRVNHVGEICAQALYRGQASVSTNAQTRELLNQAAAEEVDHLAW